MCKITIPKISTLDWKFEDSDSAHFFEDGNRVKIPSEIMPPLFFFATFFIQRWCLSLKSVGQLCKTSRVPSSIISWGFHADIFSLFKVWILGLAFNLNYDFYHWSKMDLTSFFYIVYGWWQNCYYSKNNVFPKLYESNRIIIKICCSNLITLVKNHF